MTVCEEYFGLMPVAQKNVDAIVISNKDVLLGMNLRIQDVRPWLDKKMGLLHKSRNWIKNVCWCTATAEWLDMAYEITKLIKKECLKRSRIPEKTRRISGTNGTWFHVNDVDSPTLKILFPTWWTVQAASLSSGKQWNFDEAVGMGSSQCQWLWHEGKNNWCVD